MSMDYKRCLILIFSTNTVCESMAYRSLYHIVCVFLVSRRQHRIIPIIPCHGGGGSIGGVALGGGYLRFP